MNNEVETGVTLHLLDNAFDTGAILKQSKIALSPIDTAGTVTEKLNTRTADDLYEMISTINKSGLPITTPQIQQAKYTAPRVEPPNDPINWHDSANSIDRLIRANNPYSFLTTRFNEENIIIFSGLLHENITSKQPPGEIIDITKQGIVINTGEGAYLITSLSYGTIWTGDASTLAELGIINIGDCFQ